MQVTSREPHVAANVAAAQARMPPPVDRENNDSAPEPGGASNFWNSIVMSQSAGAPGPGGGNVSCSPRSACISEDQSSVKSDELSNIRVKLMCSFGGKILPRPHDNQLRYTGGETRIVALDRNITLPELMDKVTRLTGKPVLLKYQLPGEDLDALITVRSDEDLENMMEEYDRLTIHDSSSRLRVFLFPLHPQLHRQQEPAVSRPEQQFFDALNGIPARGNPPAAASNGGEIRLPENLDLGEEELLFDFQFQRRSKYNSPRSVSPHKLPPARIPLEASPPVAFHPDLRHRYLVMQQQQQQPELMHHQQQPQPRMRSTSRSPTRGSPLDESPRNRTVLSPSRFRDAATAAAAMTNAASFRHLGLDNPANMQAAYEQASMMAPSPGGAPIQVQFHPPYLGRIRVRSTTGEAPAPATIDSPERASELQRHK